MKLLVGAEEGEGDVDEIFHSEVQQWCVDNGFELVMWKKSATPTSAAPVAEDHTAHCDGG